MRTKKTFPYSLSFILLILFLLSACNKDPSYSLHTEVIPEGAGSISPDNGVYSELQNIDIKAEPADSTYRFIQWGGDISGKSNPLSISIDQDLMVVAEFQQIGQVQGKIFDVFMEDTTFLQPDRMLVNGAPVNVGTDGFFSTRFSRGVNDIVIESEFHKTFRDTVIISWTHTDLELSFQLIPIKEDYFPLYTGNQWIYDYMYQAYGQASNQMTKNGTITWTVVESKKSSAEGDSVFVIEKVYDARERYLNYMEEWETRDVVRTSTFSISQTPKKLLDTILFEDLSSITLENFELLYRNQPDSLADKVPRYFLRRHTNSSRVVLGSYRDSLFMEAGVGITFKETEVNGNHSAWYEQYKLQDK